MNQVTAKRRANEHWVASYFWKMKNAVIEKKNHNNGNTNFSNGWDKILKIL